MEQFTSTCLKSCHGIYGDIEHITHNDTVTISRNGEATETIFEEYLDYKRGFETHYLEYFSNITESYGSPFRSKFVTREVASCKHTILQNQYGDCTKLAKDGYVQCGGDYNCNYETQEKLQVVEIYFDTSTFDKITRDAKTNNIAKISLIGGTFGLLTGKYR